MILLLAVSIVFGQTAAPTPSYRLLEQRAAIEGAAAVRGGYRNEIKTTLDVLEPKPAPAAQLRGLPYVQRRVLTLTWVFDLVASWASVERRAPAPLLVDDGRVAALESMVATLEQTEAVWRHDLSSFEVVWHGATPAERTAIGVPVFDRTILWNDQRLALDRVADLATHFGTDSHRRRVARLRQLTAEAARRAGGLD